MGKGRRLRRERELRDDPIGAVVSTHRRGDLLDLLVAAASSPTAVHRLNSIAGLIVSALKNGPTAGQRPPARGLDGFLDAVDAEHPELLTQRDWLPPDPRQDVRVRLDGELFRLHPGGHERPVANIARALRLIRCADSHVHRQHSFRISDLLELALRHVDACLAVQSPAWGQPPVSRPSKPAQVTAEEVAAARRLPDIRDTVVACRRPAAVEAALAWATTPLDKLTYSTEPWAPAVLGATLVIDTPDGPFTLPPPLMLEGLEACLHALASEAGRDPAVAMRWSDVTLGEIGRALARSRYPLLGPFTMKGRTTPILLLEVARRHFLAVGSVGLLDMEAPQGMLLDAVANLKRVTPGAILQHPDGPFPVPEDARMQRAVILSTPAHLATRSPDRVPVITLDDLSWMCHDAAEHPDDVFDFVSDLTDSRGAEQVMGWETINVFEQWRDQGRTLLPSGHDYNVVMFEPHRGLAEWDLHATLLPAERALVDLGLPPVDGFAVAEPSDAGGWRLYEPSAPSAWMLSGAVPAAIEIVSPQSPDDDAATAADLAASLDWMFEQAAKELSAAIRDTSQRHLVIRCRQTGSANSPVSAVPGDDVTLEWTSDLQERELERPGYTHAALIDVVVAGLEQRGTSEVLMEAVHHRLKQLDPSFRADAMNVPHSHVELPTPYDPNSRDRGSMIRQVAQAILTAGTAPGSYTGRDAMAIETGVVHPNLEAELLRRLGGYNGERLLRLATEQLEEAVAQRVRDRTHAEFNARLPTITFDPAARAVEAEQTGAEMVRAITMVIEHILSTPPAGTVDPDRRDWTGILAIARLVIESGLRSEQLAFGLTPANLRVDDDGVVDTYLTAPPRVDFDQLHHRRADETMGGPDVAGPPADHPAEDAAPRTITELMPELVPVDDSVRGAYGFSLQTLLDVLDVAQRWPVPDGEVIATICPNELVEACVEVGVEQGRAAAAVDRLTLRGNDLAAAGIEHWELERREVRAVTRPLLEAPDGNLLVPPWFVGASRSVYIRYLRDGRLPWPPAATETPVVMALRELRQSRNSALEQLVHDQLSEDDLHVRSRIRPHKAKKLLGLEQLSGEIDTLAVNDADKAIWVIETKDPQEAFSIKQIDQQLADFHDEGGYVDKLIRKATDVSTDPQTVAVHLGSEQGGPWEVRPVMVLRRWEHAAFARGSAVPFTVLDEVRGVVSGHGKSVQVEAN